MLHAVPDEVKACPQWIAWQYVWNTDRNKWDKIPLSCRTGRKCDVTSPASWVGFDEACAVMARLDPAQYGLGFVLGYNSGIVGADFDAVFDTNGAVLNHNRHNMAATFNSYTELSPSRTGLHVLMKGVFNDGRRYQGVELYGTSRFFTVTGNVYGGRTKLEMRQTEIATMVQEIDTLRSRSTVALDYTTPDVNTDETIHSRACAADNGTKYLELWHGRWQQYNYPSQSEADGALVNIIGFYSDSPSQIARMFRLSVLGQRDKAGRLDYLTPLIQKSQDRKPPMVPIPSLPVEHVTVPSGPVPNNEDAEIIATRESKPFTCPPGFVGWLWSWFGMQSTFPMDEINVIGALGVMAGICGRQYQYSGTGLNLYMMLLALTGAGKESLTDGITRLFSSVVVAPPNFDPSTANVNSGFPAAAGFLGNFDLTSGVGIKRSFNESDTLCCVSAASEFSQTMTQLADPKAHQGLKDARQVMLDFYSKSGKGVTYQGKMNADKSKDIKVLQSPTLSIVAQGTPERFYEALTDRLVSDGLLSRFMVIEVNGYVAYNPAHSANAPVPEAIRSHLAAMCQQVLMLRQTSDLRIDVQHTQAASDYSDSLRQFYRVKLETASDEINRALWNRAHQNIIRIAALVAIGCNMHTPVIEVEHLQWANGIIYRQCTLMVDKFKRGETGKPDLEEGAQYNALFDVVQAYAGKHLESFAGDKKTQQAKMAGVIPYYYIMKAAYHNKFFKHDKRGPANALRNVTDQLVKSGVLRPVAYGENTGSYYTFHL